MPRAFTPKVITANALLEGDAIWFTENNEWSRDIADALDLDTTSCTPNISNTARIGPPAASRP